MPYTPLKLDDIDFVWQDVFRLFDNNADGWVTLVESWNTLKNSVGNFKTDQEIIITDNMTRDDFYTSVRVLYNRADMNHDRRITFNEFVDLYNKVHPNSKFNEAS